MSLDPSGKSFVFFTKMVDELVLTEAPKDPELADGIKWLNDQALKKGITFYEIVFQTLYKHDLKTRASDWNQARSSN